MSGRSPRWIEAIKRRGLPNGYTRLEYIRSTGTQYIDTGFKANNNTRIVMSVAATPRSANGFFFGARTNYQSNAFGVLTRQNAYRFDYGDQVTTISNAATGKFVIDTNKNIVKFNDATVATATEAQFQCVYNMTLFANNNAKTLYDYHSFDLYSCQMYDNGTLIRNLIPCKNTSNVIGLYDAVNDQFYSNAGSGVFTAGPEV